MNLKSLRDLLLEQSVRYFAEIFLESQKGPGTFSYVLKKGIYITPHLFESILLKSDQTFWPIPYKFIKPCLSKRDVLLWTDVDIKSGTLNNDDLLDISKSNLPLKQLHFVTNVMTKGMMDVLRKYSADLEFLQILCTTNWSEISDKRSTPKAELGESIKFPKLKRLVLKLESFFYHYFEMLDISQSHVLEELVVINLNANYSRSLSFPRAFEKLIESGCLLENLRSLTLMKEVSLNDLNHISNCRSLGFLELHHSQMLPDFLPDVFDKMPYLKSLIFIPGMTVNLPGLNVIQRGLIRYAEIKFSHDERSFEIKLVSSYDLENILLLLETRSESYYYVGTIASTLLECLLQFIIESTNQVSPQQLRRVEKVILEYLKRFRSRQTKLINNIHLFSKDFIMKLSDLIVNTPMEDIYGATFFDMANCQELKNFMYSYVTSHPGNSRSLKYLSHLIFCDSVCKDPSFKPAWKIINDWHVAEATNDYRVSFMEIH